MADAPQQARALWLPERQAAQLDELVLHCSEQLGETPEAVRRAVEIAVITRGIAAVRASL